MDSKQLVSLETVLEIEGLVMLINNRREQTPCQIYDLISSKLESLLTEIDSLREEYQIEENEYEFPCPDDIMPEKPDVVLSDVVENEEAVNETPVEHSEPEPSTEDMEEIAASTELEEVKDADYASETQKMVTPEQPDKPTNTPPIPPVPCVDTKSVTKSEIPRFSLNDKYVFRRELFNFSDEEMTDALNVASVMTSAEEVEDYFYNDLCWDPENETVRHFISIITARFKSRGY